MKVIVTGGTGFIGKALVDRLLATGHHVTVLTRDPEHAATVLPARVATAAWDVTRPLAPATLAGADAIVHLAGEGIADARWTPARKHALRESRVLGTRRLVEALAGLMPGARPRVLVAASAIGYYGDRGDELLTEDSAPGDGFLADICRAWEREAAAAEPLGVRTALIRIGVVLGPDGGALAKLLPVFRLGLGGRVGSGQQWMSWIHRDDVVGLIAFALGHPQATGPINAVAPAPVTNATFSGALAHVLGRPALLPVPATALRLALGEMSTVLLASQRVRPARAADLGYRFRFPALGEALTDLCRDADHHLVAEQWVPCPPEQVFPFFAEARNLEELTPPFLHFQVLSTSTPELSEGSLIDYRLRLHGLPLHWQSRIESFTPGERFVDRQTRGPYALWHHTHEFEPWAGGTIVRDRVRYRLPADPLAAPVVGGLVAHDLERIFAFRRARIAERFGSAPRDAHATGGPSQETRRTGSASDPSSHASSVRSA